MYFANIDELKKQHKTGQYKQQYSFIYLLILLLVAYLPILVVGYEDSSWTRWAVFAEGTLTILTLVAAYKANGGAEGAQFLDKLLSIGFVVGLRLLPFIIVASVAGGFGDAAYHGNDNEAGPYYVAITAIIGLLYLWRVTVHMKDVR